MPELVPERKKHIKKLRRFAGRNDLDLWSLDECHFQQRGSGYKFSPLVGEDMGGEGIAGYLSEKFFWFGPPLLLKRDNGGNVNHVAVNGFLSEFFVLPLNSPEYYAPYNGAIEASQREKLVLDVPCSYDPVAVYTEVAAPDLNHRLRPCLNGKTSCQVFWAERPGFSRLERREIYDILMERVKRILGSMNQFGKVAREPAWQIAVESWLQSRGFIKVHIPKKCHPILAPFFAHE